MDWTWFLNKDDTNLILQSEFKNGAKRIFSLFLFFLKTKFSAMSFGWIKHSKKYVQLSELKTYFGISAW